MTRIRLNWSDYTAGALSSPDFAWRQQNGAVTANVSSTSLNTVSTGVGTKVLAYTPANDIDDMEVLVKFQLSSDYGKQGIVSLRYGGTSEANTTGYTLSGSFIDSAGQLAIDEGSTGYVVWVPWNYLPNITYWVRFRIAGSRLMAKVWNDGSAEPSSWMINYTNNVQSTGDYSGFHQYNTGTIYYYYAAFGTNGSIAPAPGDSLVEDTSKMRNLSWESFQQEPTDNYTAGRTSAITDIAIHWWDDPDNNPTLQGVINHFKDPASQVSAHFVVSGNTIVQMVDINNTAWHCLGNNDYTIGIETDPNLPDGTYESVASLVRFLRNYLNAPLPLRGHHQFPGNETTSCPGFVSVPFIEGLSEVALGDNLVQFRTDTGTGYAFRPVRVWDGTRWVNRKAKYWNGSAWVE